MRRRVKVCSTPGCPNLSAGGKCAECIKAYDASRGTASQRGYDAAWRKIRDNYIRRFPVCETHGCTNRATDVDHIDGSGPRGDNSDRNLRSMCKRCHSRKTVRENRGFGRF